MKMIQLYYHKRLSKYYTLVDDDDYVKCKKIQWRAQINIRVNDKIIYVYGYDKKKCISLHKFIMNSKRLIDHKDHNPLNNQKSNLRFCTPYQNSINRKSINIGTGYRGVYKSGKRWYASICKRRKIKNLGYFNNKIDAALAYNKAAKKFWGEFAVLNIIDAMTIKTRQI